MRHRTVFSISSRLTILFPSIFISLNFPDPARYRYERGRDHLLFIFSVTCVFHAFSRTVSCATRFHTFSLLSVPRGSKKHSPSKRRNISLFTPSHLHTLVAQFPCATWTLPMLLKRDREPTALLFKRRAMSDVESELFLLWNERMQESSASHPAYGRPGLACVMDAPASPLLPLL
ncbi:hypothetical protein B0F90DRAFT_832080 [Multifurca ochricompacta]|uniref:Uncharacterized protein n=1 Tax=Multifurca ochricompacta TaxID=376703 RepID=A0AAD4QJL1_9AGAM|nr:hypothetical protein B0F90DRAFT_832080 [Multifurca ochricompacta]